MNKPKIAIIGTGNVGSAIEKGATTAGYEAKAIGSEPEDVQKGGAWADVIVLAIPATARQDVIKTIGGVKDKTIVDVTNLLNEDWSYAGDVKKSGAEQVQEWAEGAHVVKAFNTVFAQNMSTGSVKGEPLSLLVAGDDSAAKQQIFDLGKAIGFQPVDVGPLSQARYLEALGFLNIQLGYGPTNYGTDLGFRVVGAPQPGTGA